jgi:tetratricopeptide (TPR) repeat protein
VHGRLASLIDPHVFYDTSAIDKHVDVITSAHDESDEIPIDARALLLAVNGEGASSGIFEGLLSEFDLVIESNPKTIVPFNHLGHIVTQMPNGTAEELGFAIIKRWPNNPYALRPLSYAISMHPDYRKSKMGDKDAASRFRGKLNTAVVRLTDELPHSGLAETLKARFAISEGRNEEAEELLAKALQHNPENAQALSLLANIATSSGRYDEANELIGKAMEVAPNMEGNHSTLALIAQLRGDIELASTEARKEAIVYYGNINSTLLAASLAITRMKPLEALEILDWFPSDGLWESALAPSRTHAYLLLGDFRRAKAIISEVIRREPENANLRVMTTLAHIFEYNHEAAREEAVKIDNPLVKTMMEMNIALLESDLDSTEKQLSSVKSIPGVDKLFIEPIEASLLQLRGKLNEARDMYKRMSEEKPHDPTIKLGIVACDLFQGDFKAARKLFDEISAESPELYLVKTHEPLLLLGEKQYRRAIAAADDLLRASPTNVMALFATGLALTELDRPKAALRIGEKLVKHSPENSLGYLTKARAYLAKGKISKAEKLLKKVRELEHYDPKEWPLMSSSALAAEIEAAKAKKKSD